MNNLSFRELSAGGSLLAIVVAYGLYFSQVFELITSGRTLDVQAFLAGTMGVIATIVIIQVVYHIVLSVRFRQEPKDERDEKISARATQYAYNVLIVGAALLVFGHFSLTNSGMMVAQMLLLAIVLAEVVRYAATVVLYRMWT